MNPCSTPSLYGVIGYPLGHSLSPLLHNTAFRELGIPGVLLPWSIEPERLPAFIQSVRLLNIRGACVTIPHKQSIIPLLDRVTDRVKALGAANTLYWDGDLLCGDNTDILGFMSPLQADPPSAEQTRVLVLGAGGVARAAVAGLKSLGLNQITITDIVDASSATLAETFDLKTIPWSQRSEVDAHILINTTPLGMKGKFEEESPYPTEALAARQGIAYDIVYTPFVTRFLREARAAGWKTIGGLEMFISQADHQFLTWTGRNLPQAAKQAVIDALTAT
ncbi:shikimate dehydrogenase family protein [Pelobacter propionicus]|uniref:Shikimate dehydrogenase (NADP(+)) n=1 Tax=Pelobacter propionicus (strain DSM 2379 / NBRC 103807 / OttBd1) TaxID=338966 RepID=AROE_PELPD|nr:shikimate dehydrogenase [Pelobacter propionicus]A1ARJ6.1 RecName: Full=Shikimate dehydrogenase (NADP(+)); Short=SDH [Pelobacter propionicus DSM 2379]ABK99966.1 shikimate dehydrogenase [Pelobacter propionicus DSM 2379]